MVRDNLYTAIDVGTSKICTLMARQGSDGDLELLGLGLVASRGLRKGVVVNIVEAREAIGESLAEAIRSSGVTVPRGYVSLSGSHLELSTRWGSIHGLDYSAPLTYTDIDRAIESAHPAELPPEKQVVHLVPQSYSVDGLAGVRNPVGMHAARLDVETLCITAAATPVQHLVHTVERAGARVLGLVMAVLASREAVLTPEEQEAGVVLVEIGGGTTTVAVFQHGTMKHAAVLPVGGFQFTSDLAVALNAPFDVAEEAKLRYGTVLHEKLGDERVEVRAFGDRRTVKVERKELCRYLHERADEVLRMCVLKVRDFGYANMLPAGVVLTGGAANMDGMALMARQLFSAPVRIGSPGGVRGLPQGLSEPAYASTVGLLLWSVQHKVRRERALRAGGDKSARPLSWFREQVLRRVAV